MKKIRRLRYNSTLAILMSLVCFIFQGCSSNIKENYGLTTINNSGLLIIKVNESEIEEINVPAGERNTSLQVLIYDEKTDSKKFTITATTSTHGIHLIELPTGSYRLEGPIPKGNRHPSWRGKVIERFIIEKGKATYFGEVFFANLRAVGWNNGRGSSVSYDIDLNRKFNENIIDFVKNKYPNIVLKKIINGVTKLPYRNKKTSLASNSSTSDTNNNQSFSNGCIKGNCVNGWGIYAGADGDKYVGNFINGQKSGQGTLSWPDGDKYVGNFENDRKNGQGTLSWPNGDKYVGNFMNGQKSGQGTLIRADGDKYVGNFINGQKSGQGVQYFENGDIIQGAWNDGMPVQGTFYFKSGDKYIGKFNAFGHSNGYGTYTWTDGRKYVGNWSMNKKSGQGILYSSKGSIIYEGLWKHDKFVKKKLSIVKPSSASNTNSNQNSSKGCIKGNCVNGLGTYQYNNGSKYVGMWENRKYSGQGTFNWKNGVKHVGIWKNGKRNGYGTQYSAIGKIQNQGLWKADKFVKNTNQDKLKADKLYVGNQKRIALLIGNSAYQHGGALSNTINDVRSLKNSLERLNFKVFKHENLDQRSMKRAIDNFGDSVSGYDVALVYYSGHGIQAKGNNYLIPVDANLKSENDVEYDAIRADRVLGKMESAGTLTNIVILDACRNNPFERSWNRSGRGLGLAFMNAPAGSLIAYSTSPGTTASDGRPGGNGVYTSALLKHIQTPGITLMKMFQRVRSEVKRNTGKKQTPWEATSLEDSFYFNPK
jgi:hypothetical protein